MTVECQPFRVLWVDLRTGKARLDEAGTTLIKTKIFDKFCVDLLRDFYDKEVSEDYIRAALCQKYSLLVDFLVRMYNELKFKESPKPPT